MLQVFNRAAAGSLVLAVLSFHGTEVRADLSEKLSEALTAERCEFKDGKQPDLVAVAGGETCFASVSCEDEKGAKLEGAVSTPAFGLRGCPTLSKWPGRERMLEKKGLARMEWAKVDDEELTDKRLKSFEMLPDGRNCKFLSKKLEVLWAKLADGSERPYCSGIASCYVLDGSSKQWVRPKGDSGPTAIGCSPKTKENFKRGEVYCKESVKECFAEQKDFPVIQNAPIREDLRWDTLTGDPTDASSSLVQSRDRELANPNTEEVHAGRGPQSVSEAVRTQNSSVAIR